MREMANSLVQPPKRLLTLWPQNQNNKGIRPEQLDRFVL